ncbi:phosphatase domain-containing protein [Jannaschia rubra]|uniref:Protein tyrosine/serine phosphatase n=1 Tax=Jannaschia rubra TaxID=282197 RepID=A0A0M6XNM0_9RHOB|nr:tyrosine-protein phosphatase [Jannaschia rubra]CTQ32518.1 Protein tyrosine/serine phosphatase [Jannaschia rubra]SFF84023.1 Tyrosine phosphatase family protein [Jannaschia rubra]
MCRNRTRTRRIVTRASILGAAAFLGLVVHLGYLQLSGNFHPVSDGSVFRAAQMHGGDLVNWKRDYGIASVLNLRGPKVGADWYETEMAVADRLGIEHIDFPMSEQKELTDTEVQALLAVMRAAPKPLLIHCRAGADRTGIASALYLAGVEGASETKAERQLSIRYGHIGLPWVSKAWAMDVTWERIEPWLGYPGS